MNPLFKTWSDVSLAAGDALFGKLLAWSADAALVALVILSVVILLAVRRIGANQSLLRSATLDLRTLRKLMTSVPHSDVESRRRYRATRARVARLQLTEQLLPTLLSLFFVGWMITWGWQRLEFVPPKVGQVISFVLYTPASRIGSFAHLVPQKNIQTDADWVRPVLVGRRSGKPEQAHANWIFTISAPGRYVLVVRSDTKTMHHVMVVGEPNYARPIQSHGTDWQTELRMNDYRPFNLVPSFNEFGVPAWLLAYVASVLALFLFMRWVLGIW